MKETTSPFIRCRVLGLARLHGNWGDQHRQSAETENASPIRLGATTLVRQKVDIFTGGGANVFGITPQNGLHASENATK